MEMLLEGLNEKQKEAALCVDQNVRIIAGAGSGKTQVLMARIEYLLKELHIYPNRILAITFTNKATREMKERLLAQVGEIAQDVRISTIHALCARILREDANILGYPKTFTILDSDDQRAILKRIAKGLDIQLKDYPDAMGHITKWKRSNMDPQKVVDLYQESKSYGAKMLAVYALIYQRYMKIKDEMKALDFDDLLQKADELLKRDEVVRQKWQNRLDFIHVDEFQDVDPIQYSLIQSLTTLQTRVAVVGDPDQTIYTWRGASVDLILNFDQDFAPVKTVILDQNYRSTMPILSASNALIAYNRNRIPKDLFTKKAGEEPIDVFLGVSQDQEAQKILQKIRALHRQGYAWKDMAILYRANYLSRALEKSLQLFGIPYKIIGGIRFFERAEIKDMLSYLKILAKPDPADPKNMSINLAIERVLNVPRRGIGAKTLEELQAESETRQLNLLEIMKDPQSLKPAAAKKVKAFADMIGRLQARLDTRLANHELPQIIQDILDVTGYEAMLHQEHEEGEVRLDNIKEMQNDLEAALVDDPNLNLETYLQDVALLTDAAQDEEGDVVTLMTVHAAKGSEYPIVFIKSVNESIFPSARSLEEGGLAALEEERRLMYVAMTRAKEKLFISYNNDYSYQTNSFYQPSRFLKEFQDELEENFSSSLVTKRASSKELQKSEKEFLLEASFSPQKPKKKRSKAQKSQSFRQGGKVHHSKFGEGVVQSVSGDTVSVIFEAPYGLKRIKAAFLEGMD